MRNRLWPRQKVFALCAILVLVTSLVYAQDQGRGEEQAAVTLEDLSKIYALPESPAFTFLGVNPTTVNRPGTVRDLTVTIVSGLDPKGNARQGVAFEFTPWTLGVNMSLESYQKWLPYILANTQFSVGTNKTSSDSASTDFALGIRIPLYDGGDPMRDLKYVKELAETLRANVPISPDDPGNSEKRSKAVGALRKRWLDEHWNARRWFFAIASGLRLENSEVGNSRGLGGSAWIAGAEPVWNFGQILGQVLIEHQARLPDRPEVNSVTYGLRILLGNAKFNGYGEIAGKSVLGGSLPDDIDDSASRWTLGLEFKVADSLWLSSGVGSDFALADEPDKVVVIADMRWGISQKQKYDLRSKKGIGE